jgi:hypothetical protein
MSNLVEIKKGQCECKVLKLTIWHDEGCNPREWDNLGTMLCNHNRYSLGDKSFNSNDYDGWIGALSGEAGRENDIIFLPLYLYDHSGITMNTTGFSDPWDSGQVGWIYVTKEQVRKEYSVKRITNKLYDKVLDILRSEVETYDQYLTGEVYGFTLEDEENGVDDSCGGFYGHEGIEFMKETVAERYRYLFDEAVAKI